MAGGSDAGRVVYPAHEGEIGWPSLPAAGPDTPVPDRPPVVRAAEVQVPQGPRPGTLYHGYSRFFSYDGSAIHYSDANACGQQAMATMFDFWDVAPMGFKRERPGAPEINDGRLHYRPDYVAAVYAAHAPFHVELPWYKTEFTMPGQLESVFAGYGLNTPRCFSAPYGDGRDQRDDLRKMVGQYRIPAVCLLDLKKIWPGPDSSAHWGIVHGFADDHVLMGSWEATYQIDWDTFMAAWHCEGFPYPNNYYAIFPWRKLS